MNCIKCGAKSKVYESRTHPSAFGETMMRRRECTKCKTRYKTIEIIMPEQSKPVAVPKPEKERRKKVRKRKPMPLHQIEPDFDNMTDEEIEAWITRGKDYYV